MSKPPVKVSTDPRTVALTLFRAVLRDGRPLDEQAEVLCRGLEPRDRGFVRNLVATALRRIGQTDLVLKRFLDRPLPQKLSPVRDVLRLGATQLLYLETPPHAVVDTSVQLVKGGRFTPYAGLVNAVLRKVARHGTEIADGIDGVRFNTPKWLWLEWMEAYGEETARAIAEAHLHEAPLDITLRAGEDPALWAERLEADVLPTGSLRRRGGGAVAELPGFADGKWWVQDAAAALPARLLGDVAGKRVVDLCAAPGGKTMQLASAGARVTAVDRSGRRLRRVTENLGRLGLEAEIVDADAIEWRPDTLADAVLLDAPCSATGTIRRHPDVQRHKTPEDVDSLRDTQADILKATAEMVAPGGLVVYCTCSLQRQEGEDQIAAALAAGLPFERQPFDPAEIGGLTGAITPEGDLRTLPSLLAEQGGMDGFFAARLRRL